jgi:hypothetical protein
MVAPRWFWTDKEHPMLALRIGRKRNIAAILAAPAALAIGFLTEPAHAHFVLQAPTNWVTTNTNDGTPEKTAPCGNEPATIVGGAASSASGVINRLVANADGTATVTITIDEVVTHAGWYRVSLIGGASSTQTTMPNSLPDPVTPATSCAATIVNPPVLPVVADGILTHQAAFSGPQTVRVTLPANVTCTNAMPCTLQVVEVMNDGGHFPPGCFYHHCADIAIQREGGTTTGGGGDAGPRDASGGSGGSPGTGGSTGSGGMPGAGGSAGTAGVATGSGGAAAAGAGGASAGTGGLSAGSGGAVAAGAGGATGSGGSVGVGGGVDGSTVVEPPSDDGGCALTTKPRTTGTLSCIGGLLALLVTMARRRRSKLE